MSASDEKTLTVTIAGRNYPLRVSGDEEENISEIVHRLNAQIQEFQLRYTKKDKQDCMAMSLLTLAVEQDRLHRAHEGEEIQSRLDILATEIDALLIL